MASNTAEKIEKTKALPANNEDNRTVSEEIKNRQSKDLVIGFCGAIGSGVKSIVEASKEELKSLGYEIYHIRISDLFKNLPNNPSSKIKSPYERYSQFQEFGDSLRSKHGGDILAQAAINEIAIEKETSNLTKKKSKKVFFN